MSMSTNWLLFFVLVILIVISVFIPNIPMVADEVSAMTNTTLPESPTVWDVISFNGGFIWDCMTFSYSSDFPYWLGITFWLMSFTMVYCVIRLVRGTS